MITTTKQLDDALLARIAAAGHQVWFQDGALLSSDDQAVAALIEAYTLADAQAHRRAAVSALAKAKRDAVIGGVSVGEMAAWPVKRREALNYAQSSNPADAPMLAAEAAARGITLANLANRVIANAELYASLEAGIAGAEGLHRDAIEALGSFAAVYAYDFSTGWPL